MKWTDLFQPVIIIIFAAPLCTSSIMYLHRTSLCTIVHSCNRFILCFCELFTNYSAVHIVEHFNLETTYKSKIYIIFWMLKFLKVLVVESPRSGYLRTLPPDLSGSYFLRQFFPLKKKLLICLVVQGAVPLLVVRRRSGLQKNLIFGVSSLLSYVFPCFPWLKLKPACF